MAQLGGQMSSFIPSCGSTGSKTLQPKLCEPVSRTTRKYFKRRNCGLISKAICVQATRGNFKSRNYGLFGQNLPRNYANLLNCCVSRPDLNGNRPLYLPKLYKSDFMYRPILDSLLNVRFIYRKFASSNARCSRSYEYNPLQDTLNIQRRRSY
ncbi:hypothetical protein C8J57DRAFT_1230190 [Mycena rebaudengoi]|nr:hypothetical protein C8J57DRAFT_1230190 [Mycena rebaudengoi]